jgi:hypothetical protein
MMYMLLDCNWVRRTMSQIESEDSASSAGLYGYRELLRLRS